MSIKSPAWVRLFGLLISLLAGCATTIDQQAPDAGLADIAGSYRLFSVDGARVPTTISHGGDVRVHSGTFIINTDASIRSSTDVSSPSGDRITRTVSATFTREGDRLVMRWKGAGTTTGFFQGDNFTMDNHGMIFVYQRSAKADQISSKHSESKVHVQKAWAGVFDDFETGLVNGWDSDRNVIGFSTFVDPDGSLVKISTTSGHPKRPEEQANNQVLQLDLDVKAWAGVIHTFENKQVDTWTPRDWRRFKSLSFWMFGQNTNASLFVEILDNRNPGSRVGDAEVYTYSFSDNFSGWRFIRVPFSEFFRKEIGNNAPNDGLGLAEVHGWAFGSLQTRGPVTYYLDNFSLR